MSAKERPKLLCAANLEQAADTAVFLEQYFDVIHAEGTTEDLRRYLPKADAYYAALSVQLTGDLLQKAKRLRVVATPSTGTDHLDLKAAAEHKITVLSLKDDRELLDRITATAELAWALLLVCARRIPAASKAASQGCWARDVYRGHQMARKTFGVLGCGRLGSIVAEYAQAFRMKTIGYDPNGVAIPGVEPVSFDDLLRRSDVLSIHVHLTDKTRNLINRDALMKMKPGAILLNTSRGAIVDETAMLDALESGRLAAAGLDVIDGEWRDDLSNHPVLRYAHCHENLVVTPHIGGVTYESQAMAYRAAAEKLVDFYQKKIWKREMPPLDGTLAAEVPSPHGPGRRAGARGKSPFRHA